jgi:S-adenosylmethionine-diacylgycerolhomoserine-N-methlytransferase
MGVASDLRILYHMLFAKTGGASHGDRLEAFYRQQAGAYDDFRRRLLHGREEMMQALEIPEGARGLDMGGGTGSNFECLGERLARFADVRLVDLSPSLLKIADERIARQGWPNVRTVLADATAYQPEGGPVDVVTFSYSLTMIPDWFAAIDHAHRILKPGGLIGVADFYAARKWPASGRRRHSAFVRGFWPAWFSYDNVFLSPDHLPYLQSRFETVKLEERMGRVPYLLGLKAPYYIFIGRKAVGEREQTDAGITPGT